MPFLRTPNRWRFIETALYIYAQTFDGAMTVGVLFYNNTIGREGDPMAYNNNGRKPVSEHVYADMTVWQCTACECWSRPEFVLEDEPTCPMCSAKMIQATKNIRIE
jgi:hypothetical protein